MTKIRSEVAIECGDPYSPRFICRYCGTDLFARTAAPEGVSVDEFHGTARCVEGNEPSYKMGGPA